MIPTWRTKEAANSATAQGVKDFAWDAHNRLTNVTFRATVGGAATKTVDYPYDMFNRLVRRRLNADGAGSGVATNMFLTGYEGINPTLAFDSTATTDVSNRFHWGPMVDQLFADEQVITPTTAGNVIWLMVDHLGYGFFSKSLWNISRVERAGSNQ